MWKDTGEWRIVNLPDDAPKDGYLAFYVKSRWVLPTAKFTGTIDHCFIPVRIADEEGYDDLAEQVKITEPVKKFTSCYSKAFTFPDEIQAGKFCFMYRVNLTWYSGEIPDEATILSLQFFADYKSNPTPNGRFQELMKLLPNFGISKGKEGKGKEVEKSSSQSSNAVFD